MIIKMIATKLPVFFAITLAIALEIVTQNNCFAGHPDQDPKVAGLREEFKKALIPDLDRPSKGNPWNCTELKAIKEDYRSIQQDGFFFFMDVGVDGHVGNTGKSKVSLFAYQKSGLVGAYSQYLNGKKMHYLMYIRLNADGSLIAEYSVAEQDLRKNEKNSMAISAVNLEYRAMSYLTCNP